MSTYHRRLRMLRPAANDRSVQTGRQDWSDLHQQRQDQIEAARGIFHGLCIAGALWVVMCAAVFAAVWLLG